MSKATIKILGIDPSMRNTGLALAEVDIATGGWRCIDLLLVQTKPGEAGKKVRKSSEDLSSGQALYRGVTAFIDKHSPAFAVAEVPTGTQSARGSFSNGLCCGLLASLPVPLIEVSPTEVKVASVGHKAACKEEMIEWAVAREPEAPWLKRKSKGELVVMATNEHLADALGAIAAGLATQQFRQAMALMKASL
jgi:Holliday junction resolvasome RuvABC endonuclease subunit